MNPFAKRSRGLIPHVENALFISSCDPVDHENEMGNGTALLCKISFIQTFVDTVTAASSRCAGYSLRPRELCSEEDDDESEAHCKSDD